MNFTMKRSRARAPQVSPQPTIGSSIFDLPDHVVMVILTILPMKMICDCRCVCKHLRNIISDPDFAKLHLSRSSNTLMLHRTSLPNRDLYLVESVETYLADDSNDDIHVPNSTVFKFNPKFDVPNRELEVLSSCNGLICFYSPITYNPYYICNPVVNEYVIVPQIEKTMFDNRGSGFGFSPKTNQYKVIRFLFPILSFESPGSLTWETEIINVGTNLGRKIGDAPRYLHSLSSGCFLNGALHWIVRNADNCFESVCRFDFGDELFQQFPGPSQFDADRNVTVHHIYMGLLGGCLSAFNRTSTYEFDIWVMKDYGVKESWIKEFILELPWPSTCYGLLYQPIMYLNKEEILILCLFSFLLSCNTRDSSFRSVSISGLVPHFKAIAYIPSFNSIKDAVMGETLKGGKSLL